MASPVMELFAKIGLDSKDFENGLDESKGKLSKFGSSLGGAIGKVGSAALKTSAVALGAATTGVIALTKSAYSAYSEYQQLQGGIETLYKNSSDQMMKYAENAYKTAGMSKNQYMEIAIESSAAMINSLGGDTEKAAEMTDLAIRDMSDNMNKMGTDMESLQNAYRGFSRGNFTMLDNLALGFSGTKQGMEELLAKAEELSGVEYDISSYADIVEAIHVVQTEMGITGTTAAEAAGTISGSFNSLKGAWQNLVTGLADPDADIGALISDVVATGSAALENMIPTIEQALVGIGQLIEKIVPIIGEKLPGLIEQVLPGLLSAATSLVNSLASALPGLIQILVDQIPVVLPQLIQAATTLISAIGSQLPEIISIISDVLVQEVPKLLDKIDVNKFVNGLQKIMTSLGNMLVKLAPTVIPKIAELAMQLVKSLAENFSKNASQIISGILSVVQVIIETLTNPDTLSTILECGLKVLTALIQGISDNIPMLLECLGTLLSNTLGWLVTEGIPALVTGIGEAGATIVTDVLPKLILSASDGLSDLLLSILGEDGIGGWVSDIVDKIASVFASIPDGLSNAWETIKENVGSFGSDIIDKIVAGFGTITDIGLNIVSGIWDGITGAKDWLFTKLEEWGSSVLDKVKSVFDIFSPSHVFRDEVGKYLAMGMGEGFVEGTPKAFADMESAIDKSMLDLENDLTDISIAPVSVDETASLGLKSKESEISLQNQRIDKLIEMLGQYMGQDNTIIVPVHIGDQQIDEMVVDAKNRVSFRSGGQVNA